jgi:hypothetical protein
MQFPLSSKQLSERDSLPPTANLPLTVPTRRSCWIVFLILFAVGLAYACYTQHAWEDFYITYRASKNFATGHGLTYTIGERVHSFTSPLGTLLPALASLMTGNQSDASALWIFRLMCISAYAGGGVLLWRLGRGMFTHLYPPAFLVLLLATDAKTIECVTNGMETAFVLLFLIWTLYALFLSPRRRAVHLGLAWAGMMWSRPDSFIYIGALVAGTLLFGRFGSFWAGRREFLRDCLVAGVITTLLYGPWLLWAWWYYGSPIPHTVMAKSLWVPRATVHSVWQWLMEFPFKVVRGEASLPTTFVPPYAVSSMWPLWVIKISSYLSLVVVLGWLVPLVRWEARVTSFAFTLGHFYLTYFANFPAPWYLPTVTVLGFFTLAGLFSDVHQWLRGAESSATRFAAWRPHWLVFAPTLLIATGAFLLLLCTAYQMRLMQKIIENGHRRPMAEWLKANASSPRDTVEVECLGYMGFFSNLKMYDYPGLSSPEVLDVLRRTTTRADYRHYFSEIATELAPDWIVLRPYESEQVKLLDRDVLSKYYRLVRVFDTRAKIDAIRFLPGRHLLNFDSVFEVYRRNEMPPGEVSLRDHVPVAISPITVKTLITKEAWGEPPYESEGNIVAHAPALLTAPIWSGAVDIAGKFGFFPGSYERPDGTPGAIFRINVLSADGTRTCIFTRQLNPREVEQDRGPQSFSAPITVPNATIAEFAIDPPPGQSNSFAWTYWTSLRFETPKKKR